MPTDSELCRSAVQVGPANGIGQPKVKWRGGPQAPQDSGPGGGDSDHDTACRELDSDSDSDSDTFKFDASLSALALLALGWRRVAQAATAAVRGKFYAGAVQDTVTYLSLGANLKPTAVKVASSGKTTTRVLMKSETF
jgi:hypothetical protein